MGNICHNFLLTETNYLQSQTNQNQDEESFKIQSSESSIQSYFSPSNDSVENESNELNDIPESTKEDNINPLNNHFNSKDNFYPILTTKSSQDKIIEKGRQSSLISPNFFIHEITCSSNSTLETNRSNDSETLKKIILIQRTYKNYLIHKKETIYNNLKTFKTSEANHVDHRLQNVIHYLRNEYTIIYPKKMKRHSKEGLCHLIWKDGSSLRGEYTNNKLNGYVRIILKDKTEYIGCMENNRFNGYGTYYSTDGTRIQGYWKDGKIEGIVVETFRDGTVYKGEYKNGYRNGLGAYLYNDGSIFSGEFENHKMKGYGYIYYSDKKYYEGQFKDNLFDGYGEFTWPKGEKYYGYWRKGEKHIFGMYVNKNEKQAYIGFWRKNKQHGIGAVYSENGVMFGKWDRGKKIKKYKDYETAIENIPSQYKWYQNYFFKTREEAAVLFY